MNIEQDYYQKNILVVEKLLVQAGVRMAAALYAVKESSKSSPSATTYSTQTAATSQEGYSEISFGPTASVRLILIICMMLSNIFAC